MQYSTSAPNGTTGPEEKTTDEETRLALILTFCLVAVVIIFVIFLLIVCKCCRKKGRFIWPWNPQDEFEGLLSSTSKTEFLIKRCDQQGTRRIEDRILEKLEGKCKVIHRPWDRDLDDGQRPVIVFCVISSRIGVDIENAMRGVHGNSPVILVLLHCVLSSLLRSELSDEKELLDPTMKKRMTGIAHFAFSDREGLYKCQQNKEGLKTLASLVKFLT